MILRKAIEIKEVSKEGIVVACFATLNVIDKDGDITLPGFFGEQDVVMLPAHDWGHVPIGKGKIHEVGDRAIAELQMNLDIPAAKDWHSALMFDKAHGRPLQEYSYGFSILPGGSSQGGKDASGKDAYRTLRPCPDGTPGCKAHEVSPVVVGAGQGTGTMVVKSAGNKFVDEAEAALVAVEGIVTRAGALAALRAKDDRGLSSANKEKLKALRDRIVAAGTALEPILQDDTARLAARVELGRIIRAGL